MRKQKFMKKILPLILLAAVSCQNAEETETSAENVVTTTTSSVQENTTAQEGLTEDQLANVDYCYETFQEVTGKTREQWVEDFENYPDTEGEIEISMMMANAYRSFCDGKELSMEVKDEVYKAVLLRSTLSEEDVLENMSLTHLSPEELQQIMAAFKL